MSRAIDAIQINSAHSRIGLGWLPNFHHETQQHEQKLKRQGLSPAFQSRLGSRDAAMRTSEKPWVSHVQNSLVLMITFGG